MGVPIFIRGGVVGAAQWEIYARVGDMYAEESF